MNDSDEKSQLLDGVMDALKNASPETMQAATGKWMKRGGKWEMLARRLMGETDAEERYLNGEFGNDR